MLPEVPGSHLRPGCANGGQRAAIDDRVALLMFVSDSIGPSPISPSSISLALAEQFAKMGRKRARRVWLNQETGGSGLLGVGAAAVIT